MYGDSSVWISPVPDSPRFKVGREAILKRTHHLCKSLYILLMRWVGSGVGSKWVQPGSVLSKSLILMNPVGGSDPLKPTSTKGTPLWGPSRGVGMYTYNCNLVTGNPGDDYLGDQRNPR